MAAGVVAHALPDRFGAVDFPQKNPSGRSVGNGRLRRMRLQSDQLELLKKSFPRHQPEPEKAFLLPAYRDGKFR